MVFPLQIVGLNYFAWTVAFTACGVSCPNSPLGTGFQSDFHGRVWA